LLSRLPSGFSLLAEAGRIDTDIIAIISNVASYQEETQAIYGNHSSESAQRSSRIHKHVTSLATLPSKKRYDDFYQASPCLLVPGPDFGKYLVFAIMLFVSVVFAPGEEGRRYLACSHTAFRTPRACLTRDLPSFELDLPFSMTEPTDTSASDMQRQQAKDADAMMQECLIWMWLVLIDSWRATDGPDSENAIMLLVLFKSKYPRYAPRWDRADEVLQRFFHTEEMGTGLSSFWTAQDGQVGQR
jgi:hypothetical protein